MRPAGSLSTPAVTMYPSGRSIAREDLDRQVAQFTHLLCATQGSGEGRVAFLLANQVEYPVVVLGARGAGFDHLPLNTHSSVSELAAIINQFDPQMLVAGEEFTDLVTELAPHLQPHMRLVMTGRAIEGWESFDDLLASQPTEPLVSSRSGRLLLLSGGSTGTPKIVVRPNAHKVNAARKGGALAFLSLEPGSAMLLSAPLYHTMPIGWMISGLDAGMHVVILERWNSVHVLEAVQCHRIALLPLVPTMMSRLLDLPQDVRDRYEVSSIQAVVHGAAPCPLHVKEAFMAWIPPVWEAYGTTEGLGMCRISPEEWPLHRGSVGRPIQGGRVIIRNDEGRELPPGEVGIVWFTRGDGARMSYYGNPQATSTVYNEHGEGTAYDMGYVDSDGYLYLAGRQKNMIIVGGANVYPKPVEDALLAHPAVRDAGVVGMPHADLGEVPVAIVELHDGWDGDDELTTQLRSWCLGRVNSTACPRRIVFVEGLPRLATGKLNARALAVMVS